jgi:glycosyltransferase involved in cell wall biosynthesis
MRILFVNTYCGKFGGVEQNIADVVAGLRERGHYCVLIYARETEKGVAAYKQLFAGTICGGESEAMTASLGAQVAGSFWDAVYVHKLESVKPLLPLKGKVHLVRMIHDHDECCPRHHKYFAFSTRICTRPVGWRCWTDLACIERDSNSSLGVKWRSLAQHKRELALNREVFDQFIVGSCFMQEELVMNGIAPGRIRRLAPCVRLPERATTPVPDTNELLFVGQLIRGKGVDLLLDAVARLNAPYHLTIAGDGNARESLEQLASELGIQDSVDFAGWVPREKLDALYDQCRVLAVPSRWAEPFGMIGLEAMHRSRPVVGFAVGGIPDWLEDNVNGFAIPERDTQAFADALTTLLSDIDLARTMGERGRSKLETTFSFEHYLDKLGDVLQQKGGRPE